MQNRDYVKSAFYFLLETVTIFEQPLKVATLQGNVAATKEKTCVVHTNATCSRNVKRGHACSTEGENHNIHANMKMLRVHVPGIFCIDKSPRVIIFLLLQHQLGPGDSYPRDISHKSQLVELCRTRHVARMP